VSGALDRFSSLVANLLVGNPESAAVLEVTFMRLNLEVLSEADVALCGAELPLLLNGEPHPGWCSFRVKPGDVLSTKSAKRGLRAYLAVTGGIDVPEVMGSRSTYVGAGLGGFEGRALAKGDILRRGKGELLERPRELPLELRPALGKTIVLRSLPGPQGDYFDEGHEVFYSSEFTVSGKADRMGYRLEGPTITLKESVPRSIISEPSLAGGVQIPPDGKPIILLVEQTVGGYAKIATVITPDLDLIAQARPGDRVRFTRVDLDEAHRAHRRHRAHLEEIRALLAY